MPAFPVKESAAVVIGNINNAAAYLTSDKTGVYSEFQLDIEVVVVSDPDKLVDVGRTITVDLIVSKPKMTWEKIFIFSLAMNLKMVGAYAGKSESAFLEELFNSVKN